MIQYRTIKVAQRRTDRVIIMSSTTSSSAEVEETMDKAGANVFNFGEIKSHLQKSHSYFGGILRDMDELEDKTEQACAMLSYQTGLVFQHNIIQSRSLSKGFNLTTQLVGQGILRKSGEVITSVRSRRHSVASSQSIQSFAPPTSSTFVQGPAESKNAIPYCLRSADAHGAKSSKANDTTTFCYAAPKRKKTAKKSPQS